MRFWRRFSLVAGPLTVVASLFTIIGLDATDVISLLPSDDSGNGTATPSANKTPPPPSPGVLPDFAVSEVSECQLSSPTELDLDFKIINRGNLEAAEAVFLRAKNDVEPQTELQIIGEWRFDELEQAYVIAGDVLLDVRLEDFGREHRIVIEADPTDQYRESDESNNEMTVLVPLPDEVPSENYTNIPCTSPAPPPT